MRKHLILFSMILLITLITCEDSDSLGAVAGIEGNISFVGAKPDSIKAIALVILEPEAINDPDNIGSYLISYSEPQVKSGFYSIQLLPGTYMGVVVGLLVEPGLFAVNVDSYLSGTDIPLVQLSEGANAFIIREEETLERDWDVTF